MEQDSSGVQYVVLKNTGLIHDVMDELLPLQYFIISGRMADQVG